MKIAPKKICRICGHSLDAALSICPDDGGALILVQDTADQYIGRIIDERFRIESILGKGGFGIVFKAYQFSMERMVALKILGSDVSQNSTIVGRFLREAKLIARLTNPNTITVHDSGLTQDGLLYICMELLSGESLRQFILARVLTVTQAIEIASQICNSLSEAHEKGIIHRDLKPDNIFIIDPKGYHNHVKVLDFGIAKALSDSENALEKLTKTGFICGTPEYMSPEQAQGSEQIDQQSDIYSLGIILYEMLTGKLPITGTTALQVLNNQIVQTPVSIHSSCPTLDLSPGLENLILQCLAKDPSQRPQSAEELKGRLKQLSEARGPNAILETATLAPTIERPGPPAYISADSVSQDSPRPQSDQAYELYRTSLKPLNILILVGGILVVLGLLGYFTLFRPIPGAITPDLLLLLKSAPEPDDLNFRDPAIPSRAKTVTLLVSSDPSGAKVFHRLTQKYLGITNTSLTFEKDDKKLELVFKLQEYKPVTVKVDLSNPEILKQGLRVTLKRAGPVESGLPQNLKPLKKPVSPPKEPPGKKTAPDNETQRDKEI